MIQDEHGNVSFEKMFSNYERFLHGCEALVNHVYQHRAWVVQEIFMARSPGPLLVTKSQTVHLSRLLKTVWTLRLDDIFRGHEIDAENRTPVKEFKAGMELSLFCHLNYWSNIYRLREIRFDELLEFSYLAKCTDPRDRVYSLTSIACDVRDFRVDYSEDRLSLFWRAASYFQSSRKPNTRNWAGQLFAVSIAADHEVGP